MSLLAYLLLTFLTTWAVWLSGDLAGQFDFWFDGGAAKVETGYVEFVFTDGTKAEVGAPIPALSVSIEFPSGCRVRVQQESWGPESAG